MGNVQTVHRSFILIGKQGDGKSTLGNVIAREHGRPDPFTPHRHSEAVGMTTRVDSVERVFQAGDLYPGEEVIIEVFDQPGLTDPNMKILQHSRNLMECIRRAKPMLSVTFIIVVNLAAETIELDLVKSILSLAEHLARSAYSFFNNAVVVFTHIDAVLADGVEANRNNLREILNQKCATPKWKWFHLILDLVDERYMFVNGTQRNMVQRLAILKELFFLTKPKLRLMFHGNVHFRGSEMQRYLGVSGNCTIDQVRFRIECIFNADLETHVHGKINVEEEMRKIAIFLKEIGQGISVMVLLISLTEAFTDEIGDRIKGLPSSYALTENDRKWWDYAFVIFKVRNQEDVVNAIARNLNNSKISEIVKKAGKRYTWVARDHLVVVIPDRQRIVLQGNCVRRICTQCLEVKNVSESKNYIENSILMEMECLIEELKHKQDSPMKRAVMKVAGGVGAVGPVAVGGVGGALALGGIGAVGGPITAAVGAVVGGLMGSGGGLSVRIAFFVLKKLKPGAVASFKKKFPNLESKISKEEFYKFFIGEILPEDELNDLR